MDNAMQDRIAEVIEELALDTARFLASSADADREERAFWRAQSGAFTKALAQFLAGARLTQTPNGHYLCPSRSEPGTVAYLLWQAGDIWVCSCPASRFCWHLALHTAYAEAEARSLRDLAHAPIVVPDPDEELLPFVPDDAELARERALAAIYAEVDDWYMAA